MSKGDINHLPCPYLDCGSSDAFSWNTSGYGQCHSCGEGYPKRSMKNNLHDWVSKEYPLSRNYEGSPKEDDYWGQFDEEDDKLMADDVIAGHTFDVEKVSVNRRGITPSTQDFYGVTVYGRKDLEEPVKETYVYPSGATKTRYIADKTFSISGGGLNDLFGMNLFAPSSSKMVTICEGELDAMSAWQMLKTPGYTNPVVSLPSATPSRKMWENCREWLDSFDKIILSVDNDVPGDKIAETISKMFLGKVYRVNHGSHKDANDFLQAGQGKEYKQAWWAAKKVKPDSILSDGQDLIDLYKNTPDYEYCPTGIPQLDAKMLGLHKAAFTLILAPTGVGKCLHPDQGVMKWDGSIVAAKDVVNGDLLMGDDSTPRVVKGTTTGKEEMFEVKPTKGDSFICNKSHVLSVVNTSTGAKFEISVEDYLKQNRTFRHTHKLYRVAVKEFGFVGESSRHNPYLVGAYLGDGHTHRAAISMGPKKVKPMEYVTQCLESTGHTVTFEDKGSYTELTFKGGDFWKYIKDYVKGERFIPEEYKFAKDYYRRFLLAGILDTDGSITNGGVEITQKSEKLAKDIAFVARSLGLAAYVKPKKGVIKQLGFEGDYFRVGISGDFSSIPFRRLRVGSRKQVKDVLRTGFTVKSLGLGEYAGFQLDGNHRFLLENFTVTHNTEMMRYLEYQILTKSDYSLGFCHLEETDLRSTLGLVSYDLGTNVTRKDLVEQAGIEEDVYLSMRKLTEEGRYNQFKMNADDGPDELVEKIRTLVTVMGVDYVFFEPIQDIVSGNVSDKESKLTDLANTLKRLAAELNVGLVFIAHANEDGDAKYCKSLVQSAAYEIVLSRDPEAEDQDEANTTYVSVGRKNRVGGGSGPAGALTFDIDTYTLKPVVKYEPPNNKGTF